MCGGIGKEKYRRQSLTCIFQILLTQVDSTYCCCYPAFFHLCRRSRKEFLGLFEFHHRYFGYLHCNGSTVNSRSNSFERNQLFFCYRRISVIANIENEEKLFKGLSNIFCHRQISVTHGSVIMEFNFILT